MWECCPYKTTAVKHTDEQMPISMQITSHIHPLGTLLRAECGSILAFSLPLGCSCPQCCPHSACGFSGTRMTAACQGQLANGC